MTEKKDNLGLFSDHLIGEEVAFSKEAYRIILEEGDKCWEKFLSDQKIKTAISVKQDSGLTAPQTKAIKAALFEVRIAYALFKLKSPVQYEYSANIGNTTVDFMLRDSHKWLIELTSLREGEEVKKETHKMGYTYSFLSGLDVGKNSPEVVDIMRAQRVLCSKVFDSNKAKPIKFPQIESDQFHMLIIDTRSLSAGGNDKCDYINIAYGSQCLLNVDNGFLCRYWIRDGGKELIKGIFDKNHPDTKCKVLQERIHAAAFIEEKLYNEDEIYNELVIFFNPQFFSSKEKFLSILPAGLRNCTVI